MHLSSWRSVFFEYQRRKKGANYHPFKFPQIKGGRQWEPIVAWKLQLVWSLNHQWEHAPCLLVIQDFEGQHIWGNVFFPKVLGKYTLDVYVNGMPLQNVIWKLHEFSICSNISMAGLRGGCDPTMVVSGKSVDLSSPASPSLWPGRDSGCSWHVPKFQTYC